MTVLTMLNEVSAFKFYEILFHCLNFVDIFIFVVKFYTIELSHAKIASYINVVSLINTSVRQDYHDLSVQRFLDYK